MSKGTVILDEMIMEITDIRVIGGAFHVIGKLLVTRRLEPGAVLHGARIHGTDGELVTSIPDMELTMPTYADPGETLQLDLDIVLDGKHSRFDP